MSKGASDNLLPQPPGGVGAGTLVSLLVHAALLAALAGAVQWHRQSPNIVSAELWAALPEAAAPPAPAAPTPPAAVPPTPTPPAPTPPQAQVPRPPPDIATERAAERKRAESAERERLDRERRERTAAAERQRREQAEREAREEEVRLEQTRAEALRRMLSQAGNPGTSPRPDSSGTTPREGAPSASYVARIAALVREQASYAGEVPGNRAAEVEVRLAASGTIISRRLIKSSGHAAWDDAVLRAIDKTARLPADTDGRVPNSLIIAFRRSE